VRSRHCSFCVLYDFFYTTFTHPSRGRMEIPGVRRGNRNKSAPTSKVLTTPPVFDAWTTGAGPGGRVAPPAPAGRADDGIPLRPGETTGRWCAPPLVLHYPEFAQCCGTVLNRRLHHRYRTARCVYGHMPHPALDGCTPGAVRGRSRWATRASGSLGPPGVPPARWLGGPP